jgi:CRISPR system Cascade subunit CasE
MILSQIVLPWHTARDPYQWHRALWSLFPDRPDAQREFLYRVEHSIPGQSAKLLMLAPWQPQGNHSAAVLATREFQPAFTSGQRLRFRLVANPVRCIRDQGGRVDKKNGHPKACRVPIVQESAQLDWLVRKLDGVATLETAIVAGQAPLHFRKKGSGAGKLVPVRYDGILSVQSSEKLIDHLRAGIGPAKAFGCGLLSLAPA